MPYIEEKTRKKYDDPINLILQHWKVLDCTEVAVIFTYIVYRLLKFFSGKFWMRALGVGCVICAVLEIYRKDHAVYEEKKEKENGSVQ